MIKKLLGLFSKQPKDDGGINKAILGAVVDIAKRDEGNILFLFSDESYKNYTQSKAEIKSCLLENALPKQRTNTMDMTYSSDSDLTIRNTVRNIKSDFEAAAEETEHFNRLVHSVFTRSRAELNEVAIQCLSLENVNVYIV